MAAGRSTPGRYGLVKPVLVAMPRAKFRSCFISAPFGSDTVIIRRALEENGIQWRDQTSIAPGESWLDVLDRDLSQADFMCAIVPRDGESNILFEVGIAYAKHKPILAFVSSPLQVPSEIVSLTYVRADPGNADAVRLALRTFLQHATRSPPRRPSQPKAPHTKREPARDGALQGGVFAMRGYQVVLETANLFKRAGFIVSDPMQPESPGADFAVWINELEQSLGSPILVEVKKRESALGAPRPQDPLFSGTGFSANFLREAAARLRSHVAKTHGRCALLIYWDGENRELPPVSPGWPLVLQLSGAQLTKLVSDGQLIEELARLRNAAVHGRT